jgi:glycosyltransferase involved in cell wall biosynthesis
MGLMNESVLTQPKLTDIAVLLPAWRPEAGLIDLAEHLRDAGFGLVLVVDDGGGPDFEHRFDDLRRHRIPVIRHAVNLGKGRALKSGFSAILERYPRIRGVVTADADGQHTPADILRVAEALACTVAGANARTVLGTRSFHGPVPLRSRFGNTLTCWIFWFSTGMKVSDTQTGLRGLPVTLLPGLLELPGERYEYEMAMLAHLCRDVERLPLEVPISTVYIEGNRSSHFDPVRDSMRIYFVLARFYLSSIFAAAIDFAGFALTFAVTHNILFSVAVGRLSSLVNFALNKGFVFHNRGPFGSALWRYYALAVLIAADSYGLIILLTTRGQWNVFAAKLCVDIVLSLVSFSVQRAFIFRRSEPV